MTATITGSIKNARGTPVAGIPVKLIHEPTGSEFAKYTDAAGHFQFDSVQSGGPYNLLLNAESTATIEVENINLKIDEIFVHDFIL